MTENKYIESIKKPYKLNYAINDTLTVLSTQDIIVTIAEPGHYFVFEDTKLTINTPTRVIEIKQANGAGTGTVLLNEIGTYEIHYTGTIDRHDVQNGYWLGTAGYSFTYYITAVENKLPLKQWTMTEVINRTLELAEPLRKGEKARFRLNGMRSDGTIITEDNKQAGEEVGQAAAFDLIPAPQFAFTKQTLRECLQEAGKVLHGEPRLRPKKDADGYYYEVYYDLFTASDDWRHFFMPYTSKGCQHIINHYTAWLDSNAQNLVNQLDKLGGVIVEPYRLGAKTVRTENQYVRITDGNMLIATQYPIYTVEKLEYVYTDSNGMQSLDITPWLFEKSEYDTRLSSYDRQYPYSKAYGIYFAQGEKNIQGLNFKIDSASFEEFQRYAITNILRSASGNSGGYDSNYPLMAFRVTYTPFYDVRVGQTKSNYKDFIRPAALILNQQANVIESRAYGENLKGTVARVGNIDLSLTYDMIFMRQVPRAGMKFNEEYFITAVAVELLPNFIRCTVGLSKDFNRLSAYIGVPSEKRYYEVSRTQAVDRNTLWREYIVIGEAETPDGDAVTRGNMMSLVSQVFTGGAGGEVTHVIARGSSYNGTPLPAVNLPVISSAFGNSISFSWKYQDNYSAGPNVTEIENAINGSGDQKITGYFQNDARYCDYYGRIYYYDFSLFQYGNVYTPSEALKLPQSDYNMTEAKTISTEGKTPYILRKDSREALQVNFQLDFVTNSDIIIGSALARSSPAIRRQSVGKPKLYVLPEELNKFTDHVEAFMNVKLADLPSVDISVESATADNLSFKVTAEAFPASGKAWAIVTPQTLGPEESVEDEKGNVTQIRSVSGGDLIIGRNIEVSAGQQVPPIYFTVKRQIFDTSVWKDIR